MSKKVATIALFACVVLAGCRTPTQQKHLLDNVGFYPPRIPPLIKLTLPSLFGRKEHVFDEQRHNDPSMLEDRVMSDDDLGLPGEYQGNPAETY